MPDARCTRGLMRNVHKECVHEHTGQRIICDAVSRWRRPDRAEALSARLTLVSLLLNVWKDFLLRCIHHETRLRSGHSCFRRHSHSIVAGGLPEMSCTTHEMFPVVRFRRPQ